MPEIEKPFRKTGEAAISESPLHPRRESRRIWWGRCLSAVERRSPCSP